MAVRWRMLVGLLGLSLTVGLGTGCELCKDLKVETDELKTKLQDLSELNAKLQTDHDRLKQAGQQQQAQLKSAKDMAAAANLRAVKAEADLAKCKGAKGPKPDINIPGVKVTADGSRISLGITAKTLFAAGKATLTRQAKATLLEVAKAVNGPKYRNRLIGVEGHTDADPIRKTAKEYKDNHDLAVRRARVVFDYLTKFGKVAQSRMFLAGYGPVVPVDSNRSEAGKAKNRRVEVVIYNKTVAATRKKTAGKK